MARVLLAITVSTNRQVQGPKTYQLYHFNPWSLVDEADAKDLKTLKARTGCGCNGTSDETRPMFATYDEIKSGSVKTDWKLESWQPPQGVTS